MHLSEILTSGDFAVQVTEYLDAISTISLTRTCSQLYCGLPRNSAVGVVIWRRYLSDERYLANRLVFETAKSLVHSDKVSRSNYKLILAVLSEKNGFMKITRLKSLCAEGKLAAPILPHQGKWKCLTRLDQFALKRASATGVENAPAHANVPEASTAVKFIGRIAGRKGRSDMVKAQLVPLLKLTDKPHLSSLLKLLVAEMNIAGIAEVLWVAGDCVPDSSIESAVKEALSAFTTSIGDTILHLVVKDVAGSPAEKVKWLQCLLRYDVVKAIVNQVNLHHETALVLAGGRSDLEPVGMMLIENGADANICDKKGNSFSVKAPDGH